MAHSRSIHIDLPPFLFTQFSIPGRGLPLRTAITECSAHLNNPIALTNKFCTQVSPLGVFYLDEIIDRSGHAMFTWKQLCFLKKRSAKGKIPTWFKLLSAWHTQTRHTFPEGQPSDDAHDLSLPAATAINDSSPLVSTYRPSNDRRRSEFVYTYQNHTQIGVYIRKIIKKTDDVTTYVANWLLDLNVKNIITPCPGCKLHRPGQS